MYISIYYSPSKEIIRLVETVTTNGTDYHGLLHRWEKGSYYMNNKDMEYLLLINNFELIGNFIYDGLKE